MLRQEHDQSASLPAAQVRVTPEELATALSRIEARKETGERHVDGTVSIGEAVQQLGVETTPEEVLAEVQAIRQEPLKTKKQRPSSRQRLALLLGVGLGLIGLVGWWSVPHVTESQAPPALATSLPAPQATPKAIIIDPNLLVNTASDKIVMLSEVGDNQPVECFYSDGSFQPYATISGGGPRWNIIKHNGQVYVTGWLPQMSDQALRKDGARFSTWSSPHYSQATLPLNGFQVTPETGDSTAFHAVNIHFDQYTHEKWKP